MTRISERLVCIILGIAFLAVLMIAGREDYNLAVIDTIPAEAYSEIVQKLECGYSNEDIVEEYMNNREYYDSIMMVWDE